MTRFIEGFAGASAVTGSEDVSSVDTGRGLVRIVDGDGDKPPRFLSYRLLSNNLDKFAAHADNAGIPYKNTASGLEFSAEVLYGVQVTVSEMAQGEQT